MNHFNELMSQWSRGRDPRVTAARPDIAHTPLEGLVNAERFVEGETRQLFAHHAPIRSEPRHDSTQISELLFGEGFLVLDENEGWAWGQCLHDDYVGYIPAGDVIGATGAPTHWVINPTHLYRRDDIKSAPLSALPSGALVHAQAHDANDKFLKIPGHGFIPSSHLHAAADTADYTDMAISFLDAPYLWGGRTHYGIDCSGLVQIALGAAGLALPRDTDLQQTCLNAAPDDGSYGEGDVVFFPGHVGIMVDETHLLHANAHHMMTVVEPLADVVNRLRPDHEQPITGIVRAAHINNLLCEKT